MKDYRCKMNKVGIPIVELPGKKYIVVSRKFGGINASGCPLVGQVATNSKLFAYYLFRRLCKFSIRYNAYTIAVMLLKRNEKGRYYAIKR